MSLVQSSSKFSLAQLNAVDRVDLQEIKEFVNTWSLKGQDMDSLAMFLYHGFDPTKVYSHMALIREEMRVNNFTDEAFLEDVFHIVAIGVIKGSVSEKNVKGLDKAGQNRINELLGRWKLDLSINKDSQRKQEGITFSRFALALPLQAVIVSQSYGRGMMGPFHSSELPSIMLTPAFCSMIPVARKISKPLLCGMNAYSSDLSSVLKGANFLQKMTEEQKKNIWSTQYSFTTTGLNSICLNSEQRFAAMVYFNVRVHFDNIMKVVKANDESSAISREDWDDDFDEIHAKVKGGERHQNHMPSAAQVILGVGGNITDGVTFLRGMVKNPRTSVKNFLYWDDLFTQTFPPPMIPVVYDGVPFERADAGEDCSDLADEVTWLKETENYDAGYAVLDEAGMVQKIMDESYTAISVAELAVANKILDPVKPIIFDGGAGTVAAWIQKMKDDGAYIPAGIEKVDAAMYLVKNMKVLIELHTRDTWISYNRIMFFSSSMKRRDAVRKVIPPPTV